MQRTAITRVVRRGAKLNAPLASISQTYQYIRTSQTTETPARSFQPSRRLFQTSTRIHKGILPETDDPEPVSSEPIDEAPAAVELSNERYHELSDIYMDSIVEKLEQLQEDREDVDVEYSAGVLTLVFPPIGTYVINKQPPNKQIWLSSPISGPKRYDYVVTNEGQNSKEGTGEGDWIYARDMSTLRSLLLSEVGVDISPEA